MANGIRKCSSVPIRLDLGLPLRVLRHKSLLVEDFTLDLDLA